MSTRAPWDTASTDREPGPPLLHAAPFRRDWSPLHTLSLQRPGPCAGAGHWDRRWTSLPCQPCEAECSFEMDDVVAGCQGCAALALQGPRKPRETSSGTRTHWSCDCASGHPSAGAYRPQLSQGGQPPWGQISYWEATPSVCSRRTLQSHVLPQTRQSTWWIVNSEQRQ